MKKKLADELGLKIDAAILGDTKKVKRAIKGHLKRELPKVSSLDELAELYAAYTTGKGCDLINGFFRGKISLKEDSRPVRQGAWDTDMLVDIPTFLAVAKNECIVDLNVTRTTTIYLHCETIL